MPAEEKVCNCIPLSVAVIIIGAGTAFQMFAILAEFQVVQTVGMTISAIARGLLLVAFSYAISNDSIKARRILLHSYIAESII